MRWSGIPLLSALVLAAFVNPSVGAQEVQIPPQVCNPAKDSQLLVSHREPAAIALITHDPIDVDVSFLVWYSKAEDNEDNKDLKLEYWPINANTEAGNITFSQKSVNLAKDEAAHVQLKVNDIEWPGLYRIELCLSADLTNGTNSSNGSNGSKATKKIELLVDVRTKPVITPGDQEKLELDLVRCWGLGCWLAEKTVPKVTALTEWSIEIHNKSLSAVKVTPKTRIHHKDQEANSSLFTLHPCAPEELAVGDTGYYTLNLSLAELGPGRYEGDMLFIADPIEEPLKGKENDGGVTRNRTETSIPTTINVRAGIFWPTLLIFLGIVAGRLHRQISTPAAQARLKLMDRWKNISSDVDKLEKGSSARSFSERRLEEIRDDLDDHTIENDELSLRIATLERQVKIFLALEKLRGATNDPSIIALIAETEDLVKKGEYDEAEKKRREIEDKIDALKKEPGAPRTTSTGDLAEVSTTVKTELDKARGADPATRSKLELKPWARILMWLTGVRSASMRIQYLYLRPAAALVLLVALVAFGLFTFYTGPGNETFGAALIDDYFPLFFWGFGTDITTRSLQNITFSR